jgi:uncharacterized protein YndB with AHSA1/START domain
MKWAIRVLAGLAGLILLAIAILWLVGMRSGHDHIIAEVQIDRSAPQVFRYLTDDDLVKKWISGLVEIKSTATPADGSQFGRKYQVGEVYEGERVDMEMTVTRFEKDRALSLYIVSLGDPSDGFTETGDYTLAEENGKTRLRFEVQTKYLGFVPRLLEPFITHAATKKLNEDFRRMKQLVEAEPKTIGRLAKERALRGA